MNQISIHNGVFHINGKKKFLITADYPYYRDTKTNWPDRLHKLKEAYIDIITFYVPWRHHAFVKDGQIDLDFEGKTQANRDVKHFIQLCADLNLWMIIKPGPFIHAEINFGGLPDFVNPDHNPTLELMLDHQYQKRVWHQPLPAPLQDNFKALVQSWFEIVDRELIQPHQYPAGNVLAIQILNEGIYSDGQRSPREYDYSESSLNYFRKMLRMKYQNIVTYNALHRAEYQDFTQILPPTRWEQPAELNGLLKYADWSAYQMQFMKELYREYGSYLKSELPYIININPAQEGTEGLDYWLTRVQPEQWANVAYGFTNWIGVVSYDESAYNRYLALIKRYPGPNMEENWSFSKLYDFRFRYPIIPFFQTILAISSGATGFNVYTGVGTTNWDEQLDNFHEKPYPDCCPITHDGELVPKYSVLQILNQYLQTYGEEILSSATDKAVSYGLYPPYAYLAAWNNREEDWGKLGVAPPRCGYQGLDAFQVTVRSANYDFGIVNLQTASLKELEQIPAITLVGGFFMEEQVQTKLVDYVKAGGKLILLNEVPELDEKFAPCTVLKDSIFSHDRGTQLEQGIVDQTAERLTAVRVLRNIPGEALYTVASQPIGYRVNKGDGCAYFVAANPFAKGVQQSSPLFLDLLGQIAIPAIITEDSQTQVWYYQHTTAAVQHIFVLSKSEEVKWHHLQLKNRFGESEDLKIRLPIKSAAIIRLENQRVTACLAKGINEYENSQVPIAIEYQGAIVLEADGPGDILYINDGRQYLQKLYPPSDQTVVA